MARPKKEKAINPIIAETPETPAIQSIKKMDSGKYKFKSVYIGSFGIFHCNCIYELDAEIASALKNIIEKV